MNNMIRVINKGSIDKVRMPSPLQFEIHITPVRRRNMRIKEKGLVFGIEHIDGLLKSSHEVNGFTITIQVKNAVDKIRHDLRLFKHFAEGRTVTWMQILYPSEAFRNCNFAYFHIVQNS